MREPVAPSPPWPTPPDRWLPVLLLLFVGSGAAALIYEIVWFQLLQLVIGSTAVSLGVLLGTFMGGMCLGSLLLPRVVSRRHHALHVYAWLELGIGVIGLLVLWLMPFVGGVYTAWGSGWKQRSRIAADLGLVAVAIIAGLMVSTVPPVPKLLVAYGRYSATWVGQANIIYMGEGLNSSVAVSESGNGVLNYHNAGKVQASSEPQDMRLQRMLGHLTTLVPEHARSVLVIGCGAGVTAGAVSISPAVEKVTIAEIEPLVRSSSCTRATPRP
jgi:predicted membrane-bound spermidine synthase